MDGELGLVDSGVGDCFILLSFFPFFHRLLTYEEKKKEKRTQFGHPLQPHVI